MFILKICFLQSIMRTVTPQEMFKELQHNLNRQVCWWKKKCVLLVVLPNGENLRGKILAFKDSMMTSRQCPIIQFMLCLWESMQVPGTENPRPNQRASSCTQRSIVLKNLCIQIWSHQPHWNIPVKIWETNTQNY